jgi:hypothetical protein
VTLTFNEGRVTLDAPGVPVRTILSEWARLGGTKVVGAEKITGAPLTLRLENVPEAEALEVLLRSVAGYMAAPRRADSTGASAYDRILVMPTSTTVASAPAAANRSGAANGNMAGTQRGVRSGAGAPGQTDEQPSQQDEAEDAVNEPAFSFPQQNPFQAAQPGAVAQPGPFGTPIPPGSQAPVVQFGPPGTGQAISVNPTQEQMPVLQFPGAMTPPPANPNGFGIVGAPTPGMVVQPTAPGQPAPGQPLVPGQPVVRPPGS